ncbi:MAG TPA: sigma-70 family RNA polymerase sigma factor [Acidimicrobiales bacterium]|nr:sigma-70 family RNA polymerase sigma factor [Acidimicrobiales bacterium]
MTAQTMLDESVPDTRRFRAAHVEEPDTHDALWAAHWARRDRESRNDLILAYEPLVKLVVSRLPANVRTYWEVDDLRSFGLLGLVEAIDRWADDSPASRFPSYATKRIRGSIFDELRRLDWLPRTVRRRVITYRATVDALSSELGRVPETSEVLSEMGTDGASGEDVLSAVQSSQLLHLQHSVGSTSAGEDLRLIDLIVSDREIEPEPHVLRSEQFEEIRKAVTRLPERQRTVVTLHFLGGLTQEQIGSMLGVSNSRVCQIEATAIQTLRRLLVTDEERRPQSAAARPA